MNTRGNRRAQASRQTIEDAFMELLSTHEFQKISVQAVCNRASVNRTTFYAHYLDIYDLLEKIEDRFSEELRQIILKHWEDRHSVHLLFCEIFHFAKGHQNFYKACLSGNVPLSALDMLTQAPFMDSADKSTKRLNFYSSCGINYHIAYFTAGLGEILKIWLENGCQESPEEMADIIHEEYHRVERF